MELTVNRETGQKFSRYVWSTVFSISSEKC